MFHVRECGIKIALNREEYLCTINPPNNFNDYREAVQRICEAAQGIFFHTTALVVSVRRNPIAIRAWFWTARKQRSRAAYWSIFALPRTS
jgi:hypothetical protein